jgi:hypothetical protein
MLFLRLFYFKLNKFLNKIISFSYIINKFKLFTFIFEFFHGLLNTKYFIICFGKFKLSLKNKLIQI